MVKINSNVDVWGINLIKKFSDINYAPIIPKIVQVVQTSIDRNFSEGGRFGKNNPFGGGSQKWKMSRRAIKQKGQTLVDKGHLASSIQIGITQTGSSINIEVGSNLPYAAIHHFGGKIQRSSRSKKNVKYGKGTTPGSYVIDIPARPFLVLQNEDIKEIEDIIFRFIFKTVFN